MSRLYRFLLDPLALALNCWQLSLLNRWQRRRLHRRIQRQIGRLRWLELDTGLRVQAMAQKFVELSSATTTDRLQNVGAATVHLSDGSCVMLEYDGTSVYLKHTGSGHGTAAAIATLSGFYIPADGPSIEVARDSLDNLYVIGQDSTITHPAVRCQAFTKGAGYSWTAQTALVGANIGSQNNTRITETHASWANTTGGTNSKGHLMVIGCVQGTGTQSFYSILDAGAALNGSGTLVKNQAYAPNFLTTPPNTSGFQMDLSADGFGASSGLAISMLTSTQVGVGNWGISSAGALTTNVWRTGLFPGTMSATTKVRIVRYGANAWAIAMPSTTAGRYMIARHSATGQLTAPTDSGAPASMPLNGANLGWDLFVDPVTATKVWVIAVAAVAGGQQQLYRLGCAVGSGVVWDAAVTTDDLLTNTNTTKQNLRVVKEPISALVDWQAFVQTAASNYALDADYTNFGSAPSAPTLTAPGNGAYVDVSGGVTLTATYNSTDGANQSAVAVRLKVGAGAYNYWRASDSTWQAAIQWIPISTAPGASFSVTVTGLSNGNADNWSMASQEASASLQGPFATDFVLNAQAAPTVVVNAPTGVQVISKPTISWTPTLAGGTSQTAYRAVVYNAAQYGAGGFTPGSGPSVWDSGVIASAATSVVIGNMLSVGTFRAYVQITETGAETSAWAYSGFTTLFTPPAQPALTGSYDGTNGRAVVNVQGQDNLLSDNDASFETTVGTWVADTNMAAPVRSTAQAMDGAASMLLSSTAAGDMIAKTGEYAVQPSTQHTFLAALRAAVSARNCQVGVEWRDSSHTPIGSRAFGSTAADSSAGWTSPGSSLTATSPSNAAYALILVRVQATGGAAEQHYVDECSIAPGTSTSWARGSLVGSTTALLEYSDDGGGTFATVRGAAVVVIPSPGEQATVYDYEAPPLKTRNYRATVTGAGLASAPSALLPLANTGSAAFWLKDPTDPTGNVAIWLPKEKYPAQRFAERLQSFPTLGRANPIVLADAAPAMTRPGTIDVRVKNDADFATLVGTITRQKVLLLQLHEQWYVRITDRAIAGPDLGNRRDVTLAYVQVDAP